MAINLKSSVLQPRVMPQVFTPRFAAVTPFSKDDKGNNKLQLLSPQLAAASYAAPQIKFGRELSRSVSDFGDWAKNSAGIEQLQDFQKSSISHLAEGKSIVAATPTSSGKTLIAEYAVWDVLLNPNNENVLNDRVFYTTPRKALSNEKYEEFVERYGADNVGLMTGDTTINRDAPVVVMTTEVLRNAFYDHEENADLLEDLKYFVLDECHFIDEPYRGMVWEETIMNAPKGVQQIHLSATMDNADEYTEWLNSLSEIETKLAPMIERPVPLTKMMLTSGDHPRMVPIYNSDGTVSKEFKKAFTQSEKLNHRVDPLRTVRKMFQSNKLPAILFKFSRRGCSQFADQVAGYEGFTKRKKTKNTGMAEATPQAQGHHKKGKHKKSHAKSQHDRKSGHSRETRNHKAKHGLPRNSLHWADVSLTKGKAANNVSENEYLEKQLLTTPKEQTQITAIVNRFLEEYPWLKHSHLLESKGGIDPISMKALDPDDNMLTRGVAPHHGGMLPAERKLVETLLREGLLKAVFATDTLAAGMNVPAQSVVLTQLERMADGYKDIIAESDYHQITGRAGRLGMYDRGYAILPHPGDLMTKQEFLDFVGSDSNGVRSRIEINPRFVLQTLSRLDTNAEVKDYLGKSLLVHQLNGDIEGRHAEPEIKRVLKKEKLDSVFDSFKEVKKSMVKTDFLTEAGKPTELGHIAKNLFNDHELVLAQALQSDLFAGLSPSELAGMMTLFIARLQSNDNGTQKDPFVNLPNGGAESVRSMANSLREAEKTLATEIGLTPDEMDSAYYPLIQRWCETGEKGNPETLEKAWVDQVMYNNDHEAGDILDVMRRTANLLRQVAELPNLTEKEMKDLKLDSPVLVSEEMRETARKASELLVRDEVLEQITPNPIKLPDFD